MVLITSEISMNFLSLFYSPFQICYFSMYYFHFINSLNKLCLSKMFCLRLMYIENRFFLFCLEISLNFSFGCRCARLFSISFSNFIFGILSLRRKLYYLTYDNVSVIQLNWSVSSHLDGASFWPLSENHFVVQ